jgi:hypothetical protein
MLLTFGCVCAAVLDCSVWLPVLLQLRRCCWCAASCFAALSDVGGATLLLQFCLAAAAVAVQQDALQHCLLLLVL